jgi:hypothetical protein
MQQNLVGKKATVVNPDGSTLFRGRSGVIEYAQETVFGRTLCKLRFSDGGNAMLFLDTLSVSDE